MPTLPPTRRTPWIPLLAVLLVGGCPPAPNVTSVNPSGGSLIENAVVTVWGTYEGVDPANAVIHVNDQPALVDGATYSADVGLEPGANPIRVELRDATRPEVRKRVRTVLLHGDHLDPGAFAEDGVGLRIQESFLDALPMRAIAEQAIEAFKGSETYDERREFFESELGQAVLAAVAELAEGVEFDLTEGDGLVVRIDATATASGEVPMEGMTCAADLELGVNGTLAGHLEPTAAGDSLSLTSPFDDVTAELDILDVSGDFPCDLVLAEASLEWLIDVFSGEIFPPGRLPEMVNDALAALELRTEWESDGIGLELEARLEGVDETDAAVSAAGSVRVRPLDGEASPSLRVDDALPELGDTTPLAGYDYDLALSLTPTALNQLLAAATAESALSRDVTDSLPAEILDYLTFVLNAGVPVQEPPVALDVFVRLEVATPPFLTGSLVCGALGLPELRLADARVILETELEGDRVAVMTVALDARVGARLWPRSTPSGEVGLGVELVSGPGCAGSEVSAEALAIPPAWDEAALVGGLTAFPLAATLSTEIPPVPLDSLVELDASAGEVTLGFEIVELSSDATSFSAYANLLVDGQGGSGNPLVMVASGFTGGTAGWEFSRGSLTHDPSGGPNGSDDGFVHGQPNSESLTSYYVAPSGFHHDWRGYDALRFQLRSSGGSYYDSGFGYKGDVYLAGPDGKTAQYDLGHRPSSSWEAFSVSLTSSAGWTLEGDAASLDEVLAGVTAFEIRGEYGYGSDESDLDAVQLVVD